MKLKKLILYALPVFILGCNSQKKSDKQITVFCAASLSTVVEQAKKEWEKEHDQLVIINAASSGTLARQIEYGAQADIFLSANHAWMDYVVDLAKPTEKPITIATNKLAIVAPKDANMDSVSSEGVTEMLLNYVGKIAVGDPAHVPLGKYTKESLEFYGIFEEISPRLILSKDARSTLRLVELGETEFGIVYLTDAVNSDKVRIVATVDENSHKKIEYEAVLLANNQQSASSFMAFLASDKSNKIWISNGFIR